jgi:alkanesulfonate monooxygenase SsuD/methylene tetrahydromethanopterin reductase-like flavin-dependent oxidoreductase (luciferase family)
MRLGLTLPSPAAGAAYAKNTVELASKAEHAGFDTLYFNEHHFDPSLGVPNPFALASAVSGEVKSAWLGVRVLGPLHHPLRLIEQTNLLDLLTRGRSLLIVADAASAEQYASFGVSDPANGRLPELVAAIDYAWNWQYEEDGPPMQLSTGPYSAQMAGRIMPAPFRAPHPLVAREASTEDAVLDAARRGWAVHLRCESIHRARELADRYREALGAAHHPAATAQLCTERLTAVFELRPATARPEIETLEAAGVAEVRLDPGPGTRFEDIAELAVRQHVGSAQ